MPFTNAEKQTRFRARRKQREADMRERVERYEAALREIAAACSQFDDYVASPRSLDIALTALNTQGDSK